MQFITQVFVDFLMCEVLMTYLLIVNLWFVAYLFSSCIVITDLCSCQLEMLYMTEQFIYEQLELLFVIQYISMSLLITHVWLVSNNYVCHLRLDTDLCYYGLPVWIRFLLVLHISVFSHKSVFWFVIYVCK